VTVDEPDRAAMPRSRPCSRSTSWPPCKRQCEGGQQHRSPRDRRDQAIERAALRGDPSRGAHPARAHGPQVAPAQDPGQQAQAPRGDCRRHRHPEQQARQARTLARDTLAHPSAWRCAPRCGSQSRRKAPGCSQGRSSAPSSGRGCSLMACTPRPTPSVVPPRRVAPAAQPGGRGPGLGAFSGAGRRPSRMRAVAAPRVFLDPPVGQGRASNAAFPRAHPPHRPGANAPSRSAAVRVASGKLSARQATRS
jgi:hypothetical protein